MSTDLSLSQPSSSQPGLKQSSLAGRANSLLPILAGALLIWFALNWDTLVTVWTTGAFIDTDDAMKMVEVRDWMNGQGWFDMVSHRMDAPGGVLMHWSRLFDVPQAAMVKFFSLFASAETAERLMRIVNAGVWFAAELLAVARVSTLLMGRDSAAFAVLLTAFSLVTGALFTPGSIDHHNTQAVLLMVLLWMLIEMFDSQRKIFAICAGVVAAYSLQISIENLPSIAVMIAAIGLTYAVKGESYVSQIRNFSASLALSALVMLAVTFTPANYGHLTYDAFSIVHAGSAVLGCIGFLALSAIGARFEVKGRLIALALIGGLVAVTILALFPGLLKDPLSAVPDLVRQGWLDNVMEAKTLPTLLRQEPMDNLPIAIPMLLGTVAMIFALAKSTGAARVRWAYVLGFVLIGDIGVFWQVRMAPLTMPVILLGGVYACISAIGFAANSPRAWMKILPILMLAPLSDTMWTLVLPKDGAGGSAAAAEDGAACFAANAFTPFRNLPKGTILSMIDPGSHFLAFTDHNVVTGPFHRDFRGLALTLQAWKSPVGQAEGFVRESGATYLAFCPAANEFQSMAKAPNGLAANLRDGKIPAWLTPVELAGTPFKVFAVK